MRGWFWSSVKRFRQQASKYIVTRPPRSPALNDFTRRFAHLRVPKSAVGYQTTGRRPASVPEFLLDHASVDQIQQHAQRTWTWKPSGETEPQHDSFLDVPPDGNERSAAPIANKLLTRQTKQAKLP